MLLKKIDTICFIIWIFCLSLYVLIPQYALAACPQSTDVGTFVDGNGVCHSKKGIMGFNTVGGNETCHPVDCPDGSSLSDPNRGNTCVININGTCYPGKGGSGYVDAGNPGFTCQKAGNAASVGCPHPLELDMQVNDNNGVGVPNIELDIHYDDDPAQGPGGFDAYVWTDAGGFASDTTDLYTGDHYTITPISSGYTYNPTQHGDNTNLGHDEMETTWSCGTHFRNGNPPNPPCTFTATRSTPTPTPTPTVKKFNISGNVFSDYNHNGVKDSGEPGTANITVTATGGLNARTDVNGNFTILNVPNGTYALTMTIPAGTVASTSNPVPNVRVNGGNVSGITFGLTPLGQIAGTVYNDINKSTYFSGGNTSHNSNNTVIFSGPTNTSLTTNNAGAYSSGQVLLPGTYQVTYTIPSGYAVTYPGPPPTFQVTVGKPGSGSGTSCSVGSYHDASCDSSGNISGMDYGITNEFSWIQGVCSNFRMDTGFTDLLPYPAGSGTSCGGVPNSYALVTDAAFSSTCTTPGIIASGDSFSSFGQGQASANPYNWVIGGPAIPETFTPTNRTVIRTSYSYMKTTAVQAGITPTDLSGNDSVSGLPFCGIGGIANCTLETNLLNDVYIANGNLTLNTYTFPVNKNFVILVGHNPDGTPGNLTILGNILVPTGSDAIFTVSGNILVDKSVGNNPTSSDANIQGLYSTDQSFIINSFAVSPNQCNSDGTPKDKRLNITGSVVVNAAGTGGSFQNLRDLCQSDLSCPTVTIGLGNGNTSGTNLNAGNGLSYLLFAPRFVKHTNYLWQELAP